MLGRGACVTCSLRFTFGVIPADLLVASIAAERISSAYLRAGIGGAQNRNLCRLRLLETFLCNVPQLQVDSAIVAEVLDWGVLFLEYEMELPYWDCEFYGFLDVSASPIRSLFDFVHS